MNNIYKHKSNAKLLGKALFYASIQGAIGSVEMSSKFSVTKDQETLQNAADALRSYMIIAGVWTLGTVLVMGADYGMKGAIVGLVANLIMMGWIYFSYIHAFKRTAQKYDLQEPNIWAPLKTEMAALQNYYKNGST